MKINFENNLGYEYDEKFFAKYNLNPANFSIIANTPNTMFFIKDLETRTVIANTLMLRAWGHYNKKSIIGLRTDEYTYGKLCEKYKEDDNFVYNGNKIENRAEIVAGFESNTLIVVSTTKYPIYDIDNNIIGLVGICRINENCDSVTYSPVLEYMRDNIDKQLKIDDLAKIAKKSVSSFERSFKLKYNATPISYFNYIKINRACMLLNQSEKNIAEISQELGFYDQSHMCKIFKNIIGISPKKYQSGF